jgi:hypothetical protein
MPNEVSFAGQDEGPAGCDTEFRYFYFCVRQQMFTDGNVLALVNS